MMRTLTLATLCLTVLTVLGCSAVVDNKLSVKPDAPDAGGPDDAFCNGMADGTSCGQSPPDHICVNGSCRVRGCGDGYVDWTASPPEQCDDGNKIPGDGCENDCTFTCQHNADCDDGNICNGLETCQNHICIDSNLLPDSTPCQLPGDGGLVNGTCMSGMCVAN